jgi:signal peptidase II
VISRRARIYDLFALLTAIIVVILDQWTKSLVVDHLGPPDLGPQVPLIGQYLVLYYIRNKGAAFSLFNSNGPVLILLIAIALAVIVYLYVHMLNSGPSFYKLIFGLIIGGAAGNLLDRFTHGSVVDFVWFRIPEINFSFAIFNLADAAISVGVFLLFVSLLINNFRSKPESETEEQAAATPPSKGRLLPAQQTQEQDAQS